MGIFSALAALGKLAGAVKSFFGWRRDGRLIKAGRDEEQARSNAQANENVSEANEAVRSLNDPNERSRVRKRFNRSE